jgi:hypothetical protein
VFWTLSKENDLKPKLLAVVLVALPLVSAFGGEEKIDELQKEVKALRTEVARLSARLAGDAELGRQLVTIARKLKAGEKIEESSKDMTALRTILRRGSSRSSYGDPVFNRGLGLVRKLPSAQRAKLLSEVLLNVAASDRNREAALKELVLYKDEAARKVISAACDLEILVPPVSAGYATLTNYFMTKLVNAAAEMKDKRAVELVITILESKIKSGSARSTAAKYGVSLYGDYGKLADKLALWCADKGWSELLAKHKTARKYARGYSYYQLKGDAPKLALAELAKVREWWKGAKEKFEFPKEEPKPAKPAEAPKPVTTRPGEGPKQPVERF